MFKHQHHHVHHHYHRFDQIASQVEQAVVDALTPIARKLDMISQEVQTILDQAKQNASLVASVDTGLKALTVQVTDLQAQIAALNANAPLSVDDKAALAEASADLAASITTLQADIPANTPAEGQTDPNAPAV